MARAYTVTVRQNDGKTWNDLATDIAFFEGDHGARIGLQNPLGDDATLNPEIHEIVKVEKGVKRNGIPWFHANGPIDPPNLKTDALPENERRNLEVFDNE